MRGEAVKSAKRSLEILELITSRETGLTFRQIGDELGLPRSSLHGLLATLVEAGWVEYNAETKAYWLGIRTLEVGNAYLRSMDVPARARPLMERIRDAIDETVQLSVLDGRFNVYVGKVDGRQALALASAVGRRLPAHATGVGKVLLAGMSQPAVERLMGGIELEQFTEHTLADKDRLYRALTRIRGNGYATDEQEYTVGVRCVAVPLRAQGGEVVAAMSVSAPAIRFDNPRCQRALALLLDASMEVSTALGYKAAALQPA
jgi:DNA-binding IclR family transcriptional regulator